MSFTHPPPICIFASKKRSMAISITTQFDAIYLSSHLPEKVVITTGSSSIEVSVTIGEDMVFSSTYFPFSGKVFVNDIRSIVETVMVDSRIDIATLKIEAKNQDGETAVVENIKVVYSNFKFPEGSVAFLNRNFLTTRKSALVPRDGQVNLNHFRKAYEEGNNTVLIYYSVPQTPGHVFECSCELGAISATSTSVVTSNVNHDDFKQMVYNSLNIECTVLGVEYRLGLRKFSIYFTDEKPTDVFTFTNAFNVQEKIYLFGATTTKTEVSQSEAIYGRKTQFYDETITVKHEVETAPMSFDEARWFSQLFTSKSVSRDLGETSSAQVLMKDITSEVTDANKELISLKFSWIYEEGTEWVD